jgi:hypothetical protein
MARPPAHLTTAPAQRRLEPSRKLSPIEERIWHDALRSLPGMFLPADVQQLEAYVQHASLAQLLGERLAGMDPTTPLFTRLSVAQLGQSKAALSYAKALRLAQVARTDKTVAASATHRQPSSQPMDKAERAEFYRLAAAGSARKSNHD